MAPNMTSVEHQGMLNSELKVFLDSRTGHQMLADWLVKQQSVYEHKVFLNTSFSLWFMF